MDASAVMAMVKDLQLAFVLDIYLAVCRLTVTPSLSGVRILDLRLPHCRKPRRGVDHGPWP